jgi:hypothetical protein
MAITMEACERYSATLDALGAQAWEEAALAVSAYVEANPDYADTPEGLDTFRQFTYSAMNSALSKYATASSELARRFFDWCMEQQGSHLTADYLAGYDQKAVAAGVDYQAHLAYDDEGGLERFSKGLQELATYHVRKTANRTVSRNVVKLNTLKGSVVNRLTNGKGVRWARVPTSFEPCTWCTMLASRGADFKTEQTASAGNHRGCKCIFVPSVSTELSFPGYDTDELYDRWLVYREIDETDMTREEKDAEKTAYANLSGAEKDAARNRWLGAD